MAEIRRLTAEEGRPYLGDLPEVLLDCVKGGASVSFMASLSKSEAESFFEKVLGDVQRGDRILLAAFIDSRLVGTVQILLATPPNQPHRADVAKLLVRRSARGQGIGRRDQFAIELGLGLRGIGGKLVHAGGLRRVRHCRKGAARLSSATWERSRKSASR